jgi:hypothetical protein
MALSLTLGQLDGGMAAWPDHPQAIVKRAVTVPKTMTIARSQFLFMCHLPNQSA